MKTQEAIDHYGSRQAVANALGLKQPSVQNWGEYPPPKQQARIHGDTKGKLRAEPAVIKEYREIAKGLGLL